MPLEVYTLRIRRDQLEKIRNLTPEERKDLLEKIRKLIDKTK